MSDCDGILPAGVGLRPAHGMGAGSERHGAPVPAAPQRKRAPRGALIHLVAEARPQWTLFHTFFLVK